MGLLFRAKVQELVLVIEEEISKGEIDNVDDLKIMKQVADRVLLTIHRRKINKDKDTQEQQWVAQEIRDCIKDRKRINREMRNATTRQEKERINSMYLDRKHKVQQWIKDENAYMRKK